MSDIKEFFTNDEWDLIHSLVINNKEFCEDDEYDPRETYQSVEDKIYKLIEDIDLIYTTVFDCIENELNGYAALNQ